MADAVRAAPPQAGDQPAASLPTRIRQAVAATEVDMRLFGMVVALVAILVGFELADSRTFLTADNLVTFSVQTATVAIIATGMVLIIVAAVTPSVDTIMADAGFPVTAGSLLLIGLGLLHLGITAHILRVTIGLMTVLAGFEIIYSAVEGSVLVAALLAVINLGLALVGSYLLIATSYQEAESV